MRKLNISNSIELNGVANIHLLLREVNCNDNRSLDNLLEIRKQLEYLERYMIAHSSAVAAGIKPPHWHDVLANPNLYPTNRERR